MSETLAKQSEELTGRNGKQRVGQKETALTVSSSAPVQTTTPHSIFTMTNDQVQRLKTVAQMVSVSQLAFGKGLKEGDVFLVMLKGIEVGLEPMAAVDLIDIIQGKPTLSPQGMLALINRTGELVDLKITSTASQCSVIMTRKGRTPHREVFTLEHAKAQQLTGKSNWSKMPEIMLKWRAVSAAARVVFPDIIQGLYLQEELGATVEYTDDGSVVTHDEPEPVLNIIDNEGNPTFDDDADESGPKEPDVQYNLSEVMSRTAFMYDHPKHHKNSIPAMIEVGEIEPGFDTDTAAWKVFLHRCESKPLNFANPKVMEALTAFREAEGSRVPVASISQWVADGGTLEQAWQAVKAYKQLEDSPPATAKNGDKQTDNTEDVPF
jgi:hypothetical protein